jgi:hypothetical protein
MKKRTWKRIALGILSVFALLVVVLAVHIYMVTRPKPMDPHLRVMARIDIRQSIGSSDSAAITSWMYRQQGVDHVLCNPTSDIVVFTFFPAKTSADRIVKDFKSQLPYKGDRYLPSAEEMKGGCPVASTSSTYKIVKFFKDIF